MYPEMNPLPELGSLSAQTCKKCHNQIYEEWSQTNHGLAEVDPLYQADRVHQGEPFVCANCHTPLVEQQETLVDGLWMAVPVLVPQRTENPRYDPALKLEGVTCVVCHQVDGAMEGPHIATSAPHPTRTTDRLANPNACAGCHTLVFGRIGDFQRPLMETITEWEQYRAAGGDKTCIDCHMPKVAPRPAGKGGPPRPGRDHRLRGPFNADFVRTAASVQDAKVDFGTNQVEGRLTLVNETGHRLPTA